MIAARMLEASFAPTNRVGLFYYCPHTHHWSKLEAIRNKHFVLVPVEENGMSRWTPGPLDAKYFADKPFDVLAHYNSVNPF